MYTYANEVRFEGEGTFFKGNIHCHTTSSDGRKTPEEQAQRYREAGYSFVCFTEHELFTDRRDLNADGFMIIPAVEWSCDKEAGEYDVHQCHHINAIEGTQAMLDKAPLGRFQPGERMPRYPFDGAPSAQRMLAYINGHGCIATYNHPLWSRVRPQDTGLLEGFAAMEVHNRGCELEDFTGFNETHWDHILEDGSRVPAVATDDNHNSYKPDDSFGGWTMVWAGELSQDAIIQAIMDGNFYASTGPEIVRYGVKDGVAFVDCSGVNHVNFVTGAGIGSGSTVWDLNGGDGITHAEHKISGRESYIRIRCQRKDGKIAWCQPLFPEAR